MVIKYDNLSLGKYYVIEKDNIDGYHKDDTKYYFEINKDKKLNIELIINNYLKKGILEFTKEDLVTSEGIPNTTIEIYNENDELLLTRETDENGKVTINDLPYGKYYIIEKEANTLYQITNEKVYFEISTREIVKATMTNEKKVFEVPKTYKNDNLIINSLFGFIFVTSLGGFYFEKKKAY